MKKNFKYIILGFLFFCFLIASVYSYKINDKDYTKENLRIEEKEFKNNNYEHSFVATNNNLEKISFKFSNDNNSGKVEIRLVDSEGKLIISKKVNLDKLNSSKTYILEFDRLENSINNNYKIVFDNIDDEVQIQSIDTYYYHSNNRMIYIFILTFISLISIIISIILIKKDIKLEKCYLILSIFIYGMFVLLFPLFTTHDELYHWFRAYEVSEGGLLSDISDHKAQTKLPSAISEIHNKDFYDVNYRTLKQTLHIHLDNDNRIYHDMSAVALYSPVQYLPQSIGISLSRLVTDRPVLMAYFGRIMNALFAIILIYFAIKVIPFGKRIIFTLAFLPISIEGFTSLSADAITISISLFLISYILNLTYNDQKEVITRKDYFIILISSIILSLCKIVYIPIVLLTFLIPRKKFKSKKNYLIFNLSIICISAFCNLLWLGIASKYLNLYNDSKVAVSAAQLSPTKQVKSIFSNPLSYIQMLVYTLFINAKSYLFTMLGENLGWGELIYPFSIIPIIYLITLLINSFFDKKSNNKFNIKENSILTFIIVCVVVLIFTSLYVQFTPPGYKTIIGVQGRYFIPIFPLILLLFSNFKINYSSNINLEKFTIISCLVLSYSVMLTLFIYFL